MSMTLPLANAADISWTNTGTGSWKDAANWSSAAVPGPIDIALIANGGTVNIADGDPSATAGSLRFVNGVLNMTGGSLAASPTNTVDQYPRIGDYRFNSTVGTVSLNMSGTSSITSAFRVYIADGNNNGDTGSAVGNLSTANVSMKDSATISTSDGWIVLGRQGGTANVQLTGEALLDKKGPNSAFAIADGAGNTITSASVTLDEFSAIQSSTEIYIGNGTGATANVTLSGNSAARKIGTTGAFITVARSNSTATLTVEDSASVISGTSIRLAEGASANATLTVKDMATVQAGNMIGIGYQGTGVANIQDDAMVMIAQQVDVGTGSGKGTLNITGGSLIANGTGTGVVGGSANAQGNVILSGKGKFTATGMKWKVGDVGAGSSGSANITLNDTSSLALKQLTLAHLGGPLATASVTVNDNSTIVVSDFITMGRDDADTSAEANGQLVLNGGTLSTGAVQSGAGVSNDSRNTVVGNGGTLRALAAQPDFFQVTTYNTERTHVKISGGGLKFDTNGFDVGIQNPLHGDTTSPNGGLTKLGAGTLTLGGINTYTGNTTVSAGTLVITQNGVLSNNSTVTLASASSLQLTHGGTDVVAGLIVNGVSRAPGTYAFGNGSLQVVEAISDPFQTWALSKGLDGTPGKENGPQDDPDGDGKSNLAEFAFNGNPLSSADSGKIHVILADSDSGEDASAGKELILTVAVRSGTPAFSTGTSPSATVDGITYTIEGSRDLSAFTAPVRQVSPVTENLPAAGTGYEYRSFTLDASDGLPGKGFLRAKVTK